MIQMWKCENVEIWKGEKSENESGGMRPKERKTAW